MRIALIGIVAIAVAWTPARAQAPQPACTGTAHHQFDFWLGEWDVSTPDGKRAGHTYDAADRRWHQFWVGGDGTVLQLAGGFADNVMTLENASNRIRFTRHADGTVRQTWDASTDGGNTWKTVFDGRYVHSKPAP